MTKPTREQKAVAVRAMCGAVADYAKERGCPPTDKFFDTFNAILADYAPLSEERRAELEWRRQHVRIGVEMWEPGSEHHEHCKRWLAEIEAELEATK